MLDLSHDENDGLESSLILFSFSKECFLRYHHRSTHKHRCLSCPPVQGRLGKPCTYKTLKALGDPGGSQWAPAAGPYQV